jgi:ATP-dependent exoDNAse (exonuclease V) alpha subunit
MPELASGDHSDFFFVDAAEPEEVVRNVITLVRDIQVLCPMNRGGVGARSLNVALQAVLNPSRETTVERFGTTFVAHADACRARWCGSAREPDGSLRKGGRKLLNCVVRIH